MGIKNFAEMTPTEKMELTIADIKKRQELREKGKKDADDFIFNQIRKAKRERDKIYSKKYRGK